MVDVVGDGFLRHAEDHVQHRAVAIACVEKRLHLCVGNEAAVAHHLHGKGPQRFEFGRRQGRFITQRVADLVRDLHHLGDAGVGGHAVMALVLDVDRLPNNGQLFGVELGLGEELVQHLIAFIGLRAFGQHLVQTRQAAKGLLRFFQQRLGGFGRGVLVVGRECHGFYLCKSSISVI